MTAAFLRRSALVFALAAVGCHREQPPVESHAPAVHGDRHPAVQLTAEGMKNAQVEVIALQPTSFSPRLRVSATIAGDPRKIAQVGGRLPGRVTAIRVQLGDKVRRGQSLVEIDGVEVHQVALDYRTSTARARAADDALARQRQLVSERVGAIADLRRAEADQAAAKAGLDEASEHLRFLGFSEKDVRSVDQSTPGSSGAGSHRAVVRAPIDGRVAALDVTLGRVLTGEEPIVTITQLDRVAAILRVYERDLAKLRLGTPVEIQVPAYADRVFAGKVGFVGDLLDPATRTLQARVDLDNPDGALKPGMTAVASIALPADGLSLWVPVEAVQPYERGRAVFVAVGERRFQARAVSVGEERGGYVPIVTGIEAGTPVAVKGALSLRGELERAALEED